MSIEKTIETQYVRTKVKYPSVKFAILRTHTKPSPPRTRNCGRRWGIMLTNPIGMRAGCLVQSTTAILGHSTITELTTAMNTLKPSSISTNENH